MSELVQELKLDLQNEESRYIYADTVTNAFVSAQIKSLREDRNLSQDELAQMIGTKQSGVSRLERADYSSWKIETLRKIAKAFGVRLRIRFEEFGTLIDEIGGFNEKELLPRKFEKDPVFSGRSSHRKTKVRSSSTKPRPQAPRARLKTRRSDLAKKPATMEVGYGRGLAGNKPEVGGSSGFNLMGALPEQTIAAVGGRISNGR